MGGDVAVDAGGIVAENAVQGDGAAAGLIEVDGFAGADAEGLPVEDGFGRLLIEVESTEVRLANSG